MKVKNLSSWSSLANLPSAQSPAGGLPRVSTQESFELFKKQKTEREERVSFKCEWYLLKFKLVVFSDDHLGKSDERINILLYFFLFTNFFIVMMLTSVGEIAEGAVYSKTAAA